ncbi:serine/threonine-protein phosphatase [Streptomyces sp. NBC_01476]|uniref:PP2C family protein-serine/threonine phosphatase n=1 Tax=Streptomyces sp. NBC_01476 TaxID=2903881 RepID=UPI002E313E12|nr:PP2C family protein-serine/threonine phosphatase [Streptomyces sp. NBC_01476]
MSPAHVRKVAGTEPPASGAAQNAAAPVSSAAPAATVPAAPTGSVPTGPAPAVLPPRGSADHSLAVQDRLAAWVCDLSLLHELTERLAGTRTLDATLREVLTAGATLVGAARGLIALEPADGSGPDLTVGLGFGHGDLGTLETVSHTGPPADLAEETLLADLRRDPSLTPRHRDVAAQLGLGASYALGLTAGGGRLGTAVWFYDEPAEPTERRRRLAGLYLRYATEHIARALDLHRAQGETASLTAELLPARLPRAPGVRMAVRHRTGPRGGGDWYDALPLPEGALGLAVGGVTGAGPGAVAAMGRLRASLRAYAVMEGEDPVAVLSDLELLMRLTEPARSATALFGYVTTPVAGGRKVTLAGAGHCPPLVVGERRCEYVETSLSAPLNMLSCWEAPSVELLVRPGENLLLFTDGLMHRTGESTDRAFAKVHAAAQSASGAVRDDPERLADHVLNAVLPDGLDRTEGAEDLVLLVVRFE